MLIILLCSTGALLSFSAVKVSGLVAGKFALDSVIAFEIFCVIISIIIPNLH